MKEWCQLGPLMPSYKQGLCWKVSMNQLMKSLHGACIRKSLQQKLENVLLLSFWPASALNVSVIIMDLLLGHCSINRGRQSSIKLAKYPAFKWKRSIIWCGADHLTKGPKCTNPLQNRR